MFGDTFVEKIKATLKKIKNINELEIEKQIRTMILKSLKCKKNWLHIKKYVKIY